MNRYSKHLRIVAALAILFTVAVSVFPGTTLAATRETESAQAPAPAWFDCTYVVRPGDTLYSIAVRYKVSYLSLAYGNRIYNPSLIYSGMVLKVPCVNVPPPQPPPPPTNNCLYVVRPGDTLYRIAVRFGVSWQSIAALNHIRNPNIIYVGMRLAIPCKSTPPPNRHVIVIFSPRAGQGVNCPIAVSGYVSVSPFEATLAGRVYDNAGHLIGQGPIHVNAEMGRPGYFSGTIPCTGVSGLARVVIAELSARDGSIIASSSVTVALGGP